MTMTRRITARARLTAGLVWSLLVRLGLVRLGKRIANIVAECNYAQRRSFAIMTNPDSYLTDRDHAPDTYAEFLFRTSGGLLHEVASSQRAHGRPAA
jgi:hypothetical protein